jgi:xylan 1,4-beta-xylosidase
MVSRRPGGVLRDVDTGQTPLQGLCNIGRGHREKIKSPTRKIIFTGLLTFAFFVNSAQQLQYTNPILAGFYPDPSICRVNDDYYLVNSSFAYFPGLPIFHSKDLVNWRLIGHAMNRNEQLDLKNAGVSRGLFAPDITYHNGTFYITCTLVDKQGNFVITAKDPAGPWSNPVWLPEVDGIDPSLYFDDDGKTYLVYNSIPPGNKPLYDGHRTIRMRDFDLKNLKTTGEEKIIINGGTDLAKQPVWIEGPHIYKKDGWYYLLCAEGGTYYNHSVVIFRSRSVQGLYVSFEGNPILTQRLLDRNRQHPITSTGHADFVQAGNGSWHAVLLGVRPYKDDHYNTGRETFMVPVEWENGWPVMNNGHEAVQYRYNVPMPALTKKLDNPFSGNFTYREDFSIVPLSQRWMFLRNPEQNWYSLQEKKGWLAMKVRPETCAGRGNPSLLAQRQQHQQCVASTSMQFVPAGENEKAGLVAFQNEHHFYFLCQSIENNEPVIQLYKSTSTEATELLASEPLPRQNPSIWLRVRANGDTYEFYYATGNGQWKLLKGGVDGTFLSTGLTGGFVGAVIGLYATSQGRQSNSSAYFNWFEYSGDDDVYK